MVKKFMRLLALSLLLVGPIFAYDPFEPQTTEEEQAVIDAYTLPEGELRSNLDALFETHNIAPALNSKTSAITKNVFKNAGFKFLKSVRITEHPKLKGFVLKFGRPNRFHQHVSRVWIAEAMREVIQEHDFKNIIIPEKLLYHIPGRPENLHDDNYAVLSEKIECGPDRHNRTAIRQLPIETVREILTIIEEVFFNDASPSNIKVLGNGKVAFIDTEKIHWKRSWDASRCKKQFMNYLSPEQKAKLAK